MLTSKSWGINLTSLCHRILHVPGKIFFALCFAINIHGPLDALREGLQLPEFESCLVPAMPG